VQPEPSKRLPGSDNETASSASLPDYDALEAADATGACCLALCLALAASLLWLLLSAILSAVQSLG